MAARRGLIVALALALGGCGTQPPDLFVVQRTGADPGADAKVVVDDGGNLTCNDTIKKVLDAPLLLDARQLSRDLTELSYLGLDLPPKPGSDLRYKVDLAAGSIAYADNSAQRPPALDRLTAFVAKVTEQVCGIER